MMPSMIWLESMCGWAATARRWKGATQEGSGMETTTTQLFWKLVEEKAGIKPATK
jgi:hypothetical protein